MASVDLSGSFHGYPAGRCLYTSRVIRPRIHKPNSFCHHDYVHAIQIPLSEKDTFSILGKITLFFYSSYLIKIFNAIFRHTPVSCRSMAISTCPCPRTFLSEISVKDRFFRFHGSCLFLEWFLAVISVNAEVTWQQHPFSHF